MKKQNSTSKLTLKQQKFCDFYLQTGNATEAAKMAGYKGKNLNNIASENLAKLGIKEYLNSKLKEIESKRVASIQEVMEFYTSVMRGEIKDAFGLEADLTTRIKSAEQLSKRLGMTVTSREQELKIRQLELEIKKKELEIAKLEDKEAIEEKIIIIDDIR